MTLAVVATLGACGGGGDEAGGGSSQGRPAVAYDTATIRVIGDNGALDLRVELALTDAQKTNGLMERRQLDELAGMLFVYDSTQPPDAGFWMFRTRIPLDIAYLDSAGVVRAIHRMVPCESTLPQGCPTYAPGVEYRYALEVNAGFFAKHGVGVGDSVEVRAVAEGRRQMPEA